MGKVSITPAVRKLEDMCISAILQLLNHNSLRKLESSCPTWKEIVKLNKLWQRLYEDKMKGLEWIKMAELLKERDASFPSADKTNFHCLASRMIGDALIDLESNWQRKLYGSFHFTLNDLPKKPSPKDVVLFTVHKHWIVRTNREGLLVTRSRFEPENEHLVELLTDPKTPTKDEHQPKFGLTLCEGSSLVTVGQIEGRKMLFAFDIIEGKNSLSLKLSWSETIESRSKDDICKFDLNNCFRFNEGIVALCGSKIADEATVVTVLNLRNQEILCTNEEVSACYGSVQDFAVDRRYVVLFLGSSENPRFRKQLNRYRIQFRDVNTFALLRSFVLPIVNAPTCHFQYRKGIAVTGSDDSPIRIWNSAGGTCDGAFEHGHSKLSALQIVADRVIVTCDENGIVKTWSFCTAIQPDTRDEPNQILIATLSPPAFPYLSYREVKVLSMRADEYQILLMLQCDKKQVQCYVMDFLPDRLKSITSNPRLNRKRRLSLQ